MGLLGGYAETAEELAAVEQRDHAYYEAEQTAHRISELETALRQIFSATRDMDDALLEHIHRMAGRTLGFVYDDEGANQ